MRRWRRKWKKRSRRGKETNPYKILLVEDDAAISEMLKTIWKRKTMSWRAPVMQHIRGKSCVPIIILSAKDSESDKTLGLGLGENRPLS